MTMDITRLLDPNVKAHPILTDTYRTIPRLTARPSRPGMITITNANINPAGRAVAVHHQQGPGRIPRQLLINSNNEPVHLTQVNNETAQVSEPQPVRNADYELQRGFRQINVDSTTQEARFQYVQTGYSYQESDIGICEEPYHDQVEPPHGPSRRCTLCLTRLPVLPTPTSFRPAKQAYAAATGQAIPSAICTKCLPLTTQTLKLDYPLAFTVPTSPLCDECTHTYLLVRAGSIPDPSGLPPRNVPCQCPTFVKKLTEGWVCYSCKFNDCRARTAAAKDDRERNRGLVAGGQWGGSGKGNGTVDVGDRCWCGRMVTGDLAARMWKRCVLCGRVVEEVEEKVEGEGEGGEGGNRG